MGGINKDTVDSDHGSLHKKAAELAVDASVELLEDIRIAVGEKTFLRYGPPPLNGCFKTRLMSFC